MQKATKNNMRVLAVCTGNICRSPIAHGLLEKLSCLYQLGWEIDSAGTIGFHSGDAPDSRAIRVMEAHDIDISHQHSRKLTLTDFDYFDLILALDQTHFDEMLQLAKTEQHKKIKMAMHWHPTLKDQSVPDPYCGEYKDFEEVFEMLRISMEELVQQYNNKK